MNQNKFKTVKELIEDLEEYPRAQAESRIKMWAQHIINECANSAELEYREHESKCWVNKRSILKVKELL